MDIVRFFDLYLYAFVVVDSSSFYILCIETTFFLEIIQDIISFGTLDIVQVAYVVGRTIPHL